MTVQSRPPGWWDLVRMAARKEQDLEVCLCDIRSYHPGGPAGSMLSHPKTLATLDSVRARKRMHARPADRAEVVVRTVESAPQNIVHEACNNIRVCDRRVQPKEALYKHGAWESRPTKTREKRGQKGREGTTPQ